MDTALVYSFKNKLLDDSIDDYNRDVDYLVSLVRDFCVKYKEVDIVFEKVKLS